MNNMKQFTKEMIEIFSAKTRVKILEMLHDGYEHPDELADELDITRQAVDKHLKILHDWKLVEKKAIFPSEERHKIIYEPTSKSDKLISKLNQVAENYRVTLLDEARQEIEGLDTKLARSEITEDKYREKLEEIKDSWNYEELKGQD